MRSNPEHVGFVCFGDNRLGEEWPPSHATGSSCDAEVARSFRPFLLCKFLIILQCRNTFF